jgi:hypothetical protein
MVLYIVYVFICMYILDIYMLVCTDGRCMCACDLNMYVSRCVDVCIYVYMYVYTCTYVCMYEYMCVCVCMCV